MNNQLRGEYWHECARCGFMYPESLLVKNSKGKWVCTRTCLDTNEDEK